LIDNIGIEWLLQVIKKINKLVYIYIYIYMYVCVRVLIIEW
jgi:hypothetical protein